MIDPQMVDAFKTTTSSLLVPTTTSVSPIPTVIPNPPHYEKVGETGTKTLWVAFVIMLVSTIAFATLSYKVPVQKRLFHVLTTFAVVIATLSYFAMATGSGTYYAYHLAREHHKHGIPDTFEPVLRQVFWVRYVDWALTTPLLLLDLAFLAGVNGANIFVAVFANIVTMLTGLFFAYSENTSQRWGWYAMACVAHLVVIYQLIVVGRRAVLGEDRKAATLYVSLGAPSLVIWTLYPVVWAIGTGARKWSVDADVVAYAVLDILAKSAFGFWLLCAQASAESPYTSIGGFWSHGLSTEGAVRLGEEP